jgi:hypothetical protein
VSRWQGGESALRDGTLAIANAGSVTIAKDSTEGLAADRTPRWALLQNKEWKGLRA